MLFSCKLKQKPYIVLGMYYMAMVHPGKCHACFSCQWPTCILCDNLILDCILGKLQCFAKFIIISTSFQNTSCWYLVDWCSISDPCLRMVWVGFGLAKCYLMMSEFFFSPILHQYLQFLPFLSSFIPEILYTSFA